MLISIIYKGLDKIIWNKYIDVNQANDKTIEIQLKSIAEKHEG